MTNIYIMPLSTQDLQIIALVFNDNLIKDSLLDIGGSTLDYLGKLSAILTPRASTTPVDTTYSQAASTILKVIAQQVHISFEIATRRTDVVSRISRLSYYDDFRNKYKETISTSTNVDSLVDQIITSTSADCSSYLPGGWRAPVGHVMQYKLSQDEDDYLLDVFNTGSGTERYHTRIGPLPGSEHYKEKIVTKKTYKISKDKIKEVLAELLKFQIIDVKEYKSKIGENVADFEYSHALYDILEKGSKETAVPGECTKSGTEPPPAAGILKLLTQKPTSKSRADTALPVSSHAITRAQYSSTCSVRSFNEVLKDILNAYTTKEGRMAYIKIKYALQRSLLDEYLTESCTLVDSSHKEQLSHALHNFTGFINKQFASLDATDFIQIFGSIESILTYVSEKQRTLTTLSVSPPGEIIITDHFGTPYCGTIPTLSPKDIPDWKPLTEIPKLDSGTPLNMSEYTNAIGSILDRGPYKKHHLIRLLENMHAALDAYKLPDTIEQMSLDEFKELTQLLEYYQQVARDIYGENPPTRVYAFYRDIVKLIDSNKSYFYLRRNYSMYEYLRIEPTNPCAATMQPDIDQRALSAIDHPSYVHYDYKEYFTSDVNNILRNDPAGILNAVITTLGIDIDILYMGSDEEKVWYVIVTLFRLPASERAEKLQKITTPAIQESLKKLLEKYDKLCQVCIIVETALNRARNITANLVEIEGLFEIVKYSGPLYTRESNIFSRSEDLITHSFPPIVTPDIKKATFWGKERYHYLFLYHRDRDSADIRGNHNIIEKYSDSLRLSDTEDEQAAEISTRRLAYPHSNPQKAVEMLLSIFVGEDKKKLSEHDYQQYFQHVIFTPLYLKSYFDKTAKIKLDSITEYFTENLVFFSKERFLNTSAYLFNLQMLTFISLYALEQGLNPEKITQLFYNLLNNYLLESKIFSDITPNLTQQYQIRALRFIVLQAKIQKDREGHITDGDKNELKELVKQLSLGELEHADSLDTSTRYQLDRALNTYYLSLGTREKASTDEFLDAIALDTKRSTLPYNLLHDTNYIKIFGRGVNFECCVQHEGRLITFQDKKNKISFRAIKSSTGYVIQREVDSSWYQFIDIPKDAPTLEYSLPKYMMDKKHQYWVETKKDGDTDPAFKIRVYPETTSTYTYELHSSQNLFFRSIKGGLNFFSLANTKLTLQHLTTTQDALHSLMLDIIKTLCLFEDIQYIEICLADDEQTITFNLKRYGIVFELATTDADITARKVKCLSSSGYILELDAKPSAISRVLPGINSALILSSNTDASGSERKKILLPAQSYITDNRDDTSSTWQVLQLDTEGKIEKIDQHISDLDITDSEKCYSFHITEDKITPSNTAEALYLAYLHLGKGNVSEAMDFLKLCNDLGGINGTNDELRWIYCIVSELPWSAPLQLTPQRDGYEYITARCRALSMILTYLQSGRSWQFQDDPRSIPEYGSMKYKRFELYRTFTTKAISSLHKEYQRYLSVLRRVPSSYQLSKTEELNIFTSLNSELEAKPETMSQSLQNRLAELKKPEQPTESAVGTLSFTMPVLKVSEILSRKIIVLEELFKPETDLTEESYPSMRPIVEKLYADLSYYETALTNIEQTLLSTVKEHLSAQHKLTILARTCEQITLDSIIKAFLDNKSILYEFDQETTQSIYNLIGDYLKLKVQLVSLKEIEAQTVKTTADQEQRTEKQKKSYSINLKLLAQLLQDSKTILENTQIDCSRHADRTALVFQAKSGICLRVKQQNLLRQLHSGYHSFVQMRMGGGKTKVLLPILAKQKADGDRLPIIVVPKSLFETNIVDLNAATMKAFGQQGKAFIFARTHAKTSAESLSILDFLQETLQNGDYIITTPDSIQSLKLKYFEILASAPNESDDRLYKDWTENLCNLEKILDLLKNKCDALIDEADTTFDIRKELQYATGTPTPYDPEYIKHGSEIFAFLQRKGNILDSMSLVDIILSSDDLDKEKISKALLTKFLDETDSPIYKFLEKEHVNITAEIRTELQTFFNYKDAKYPDLTSWTDKNDTKLNDEQIAAIKKFLAFYSIQIHSMLPSTLNRKHNQHYGRPNPEKVVKPFDGLVTIPFEAAKKPKHGSRFSNIIEEINYSFQSALLNPVPFEIGRLFVLGLYASCLSDPSLMTRAQEILCPPSTDEAEKIDIAKIDIDKNDDIKKVLKLLNGSNAFRLLCTAQYGLASQTYSSHVLTSTAITHACLYGCASSMTGTPWNLQAMHPRITEHYTPDTSGEAEVLANLRNTEKTTVSSYGPDKDIKITINTLSISTTKETRTLIDIAGSFRDSSNLEVACAIAEKCLQLNKDIKYILFFDTDNCLYALDVTDITKKIKLPSTDKKDIAAKLNCEPDACFTYYDQQHTTGVDIKQMTDANALVLVDGHTLHRDILQGVMRMRQLPESQTLRVLITSQLEQVLQKKYSKTATDPITIHEILHNAEEYEKTFVEADKLKAIKARYNNIYADALCQILSIPEITAQEKYKLFNKLNESYQTYLRKIDTSITRFYESRAPESQSIQDTWSEAIKEIITEEETKGKIFIVLENIKKSLEKLKEEPSTTTHPCETIMDHAGQSMEVQVEQVVEKTLMTETEMRREICDKDPEVFHHQAYFTSITIANLNACPDYSSILPPSAYSPALTELKISPNFLQMFQHCAPLEYGSKPVHKIAFYTSPDDKKLKAILITAEDDLDITELDITVQEITVIDLFHPSLPDAFRSPREDFNILMAKAYFINGNFDLALKFAPTWVTTNRAYLYELATKHLKNVRLTTMGFLIALESDASLAAFMQNLEHGKTQGNFKQFIDEFSKDALDPETIEKIEKIESASALCEANFKKLDSLLGPLPNSSSSLQDRIKALEQAKSHCESSIKALTGLINPSSKSEDSHLRRLKEQQHTKVQRYTPQILAAHNKIQALTAELEAAREREAAEAREREAAAAREREAAEAREREAAEAREREAAAARAREEAAAARAREEAAAARAREEAAAARAREAAAAREREAAAAREREAAEAREREAAAAREREAAAAREREAAAAREREAAAARER
ncbi:MAG: DUF3638 domain-containing protein, partial [Gammaproteobacteria bacterium]|nr:DUF3638 domain-containing protein [Gammaproteobacteria bacterium]